MRGALDRVPSPAEPPCSVSMERTECHPRHSMHTTIHIRAKPSNQNQMFHGFSQARRHGLWYQTLRSNQAMPAQTPSPISLLKHGIENTQSRTRFRLRATHCELNSGVNTVTGVTVACNRIVHIGKM